MVGLFGSSPSGCAAVLGALFPQTMQAADPYPAMLGDFAAAPYGERGEGATAYEALVRMQAVQTACVHGTYAGYPPGIRDRELRTGTPAWPRRTPLTARQRARRSTPNFIEPGAAV